MKKNVILSVFAILIITLIEAQTQKLSGNLVEGNGVSAAFMDFSVPPIESGTIMVSRGLLFPRTDLSFYTTIFDGETVPDIGESNNNPNYYDGLIVYNTATSGTAAIGNTSGTLSVGYWYYENTSGTWDGGTWKPLAGSGGGGGADGNDFVTAASLDTTTLNLTGTGGAGASVDLAALVGTDDQTATEVAVAASPTNYTAASADVEAHLAGIDSALASAGGSGSTYDITTTEATTNAQVDGTAVNVIRVTATADGTNATLDLSANIANNLVTEFRGAKVFNDTTGALVLEATSFDTATSTLTTGNGLMNVALPSGDYNVEVYYTK